MEKCGDAEDCVSTSEAAELVASLDENVINNLPLPGQVDFINGGPPCQVMWISDLTFAIQYREQLFDLKANAPFSPRVFLV